jgi:hypothetical protein
MADVNLATTETLTIGLTDTPSALAKTTPSTLVEYLIAGETIFPSGYDIAAVAGDGITMRETTLSDNWVGLIDNSGVISGFAIPETSANLVLAVPSGVAVLTGRYVAVPGVNLTVSPSVTSYIYLKLTRDVNLNVTGAWYEVNTTGTQPADSLTMAVVIASGVAITSAWAAYRRAGMKSSIIRGPISLGSGSGKTHEGHMAVTTNSNGNGVRYCESFYLKTGVTLTLPNDTDCLVIVASGAITINGTIDAQGAGSGGGAGGASGNPGSAASNGMGQPGGGGGVGQGGVAGGAGGAVLVHGFVIQGGGASGSGGTQVTGASIVWNYPMWMVGGGGGGGGGGQTGTGGAGGRGGGNIILIAPFIFLGSASVLKTSGDNGAVGGHSNAGTGGGGGAGNIFMRCASYNNGGCTFTQAGGTGPASGGTGGAGGTGAAGIKEIDIYA